MSESKSTATRAKMVPDQEFIKAYVAVTKLEDGTDQHVADMLGLKVGTVKVRASVLRKKLREQGVEFPKMQTAGRRGRAAKDWTSIAKLVEAEKAREALAEIDEIEAQNTARESRRAEVEGQLWRYC